MPTLLSYITEKKLTKHPEEFGSGAIEGVAGPEAANNASAAGTLVPLLAIGLPTTATAAVILAAMQSYGLQPGPALFDNEPLLVWTLLASLFIANTLLLLHQPAAGAAVGQAAAHAAALPLRRHPVLRLARRLQRQLPGLRPAAAAGLRPARAGDAALRHPGAAADHRGDPRPALEYQLAQALAISRGDVSTLWSEPVAVVVYVVIAVGWWCSASAPARPARPLVDALPPATARHETLDTRPENEKVDPHDRRRGLQHRHLRRAPPSTTASPMARRGRGPAGRRQRHPRRHAGRRPVRRRAPPPTRCGPAWTRCRVEAELRQSMSPDVADEVLAVDRGGAAPAARGRRPPPHPARAS